MLEVQLKKLKQALDALGLIGAQYKVITPDGTEYGDLEVKPVRPTETASGLPRYRRMETRDIFAPHLANMKAGQVKVIECGDYDPRVISRDIAAYFANSMGAGFVSCLTMRETGTVQVLALKNLA
jgi:hypothetical protein